MIWSQNNHPGTTRHEANAKWGWKASRHLWPESVVGHHTNLDYYIQLLPWEGGRKIPHISFYHHRLDFLHTPSNLFLVKVMTDLSHRVMLKPISLQHVLGRNRDNKWVPPRKKKKKTKLIECPLGQRPCFLHLYSPTAQCRHGILQGHNFYDLN